jgi:glycosyltransferase involved in cell wall biosynthesis
MVRDLGLSATVRFHRPMPARQAFALALAVVVPSRAESMPYIVLEAIGAGMPLVATRVGGIPEIFGPASDRLVPPGDAPALAAALAAIIPSRPKPRRFASAAGSSLSFPSMPWPHRSWALTGQ